MPQKNKGARLWLEPAREGNRQATWVIRDGGMKRATGCLENQREMAELALQDYLSGKPKKFTYYLYFISARHPNFPIKIGITAHRSGRFSCLQTSIPYDLEVLAMVEVHDPIAERKLHCALAEHRLRGEWFERCPAVLDLIERISAASGTAESVAADSIAATNREQEPTNVRQLHRNR